MPAISSHAQMSLECHAQDTSASQARTSQLHLDGTRCTGSINERHCPGHSVVSTRVCSGARRRIRSWRCVDRRWDHDNEVVHLELRIYDVLKDDRVSGKASGSVLP